MNDLLNETDSTIIGKIKQFINNLLNKVRAMYNGIEPDSDEAKALSKMTDSLDKLHRLFEEAAVDAVKSKQAVGEIKNSGKSTGIEFSQRIDSYPYDMQTVIKDYLASVDQGMLNFIDEHFNNQVLKFGRYSISSVTPKQINDLNLLLNVDVSGYTNAINTNAIQHIKVRHGVEGKADRSMSDNNDIARIEYILNNYDDVDIVKEGEDDAVSREFRDSENNPVPLIQYTKKINGTYYVIQAVPESAYKKLWVVSAFISKNKEVVTQAPNTEKKSPVGMFLTSPTSDNSIPTSDKNVKDDIKNSTRDYSYDALVSKPDMVITALPTVTQTEFNKYKNDTSLFAKDMRKIATQIGNSKNTETSTYLYNLDLKKDVLITKNSYKHGAERFDSDYVAVCKVLPDVLKNAIVVNELMERADTNGSYVLLGIAENSTDYSIIRLIVNKKTWQLDEYEELYAIKKKTSAKSLPNSTQKSNKGQMSSAISISNFLTFVNNEKLGSSVLSDDVINNLGNSRLADTNITPSLIYSTRDNVPSAYELLGKTEQLEKRNLKLQEDIVRLQELVKLQSKVTHGKMFTDSSLSNAAKQIAKLGNSKIDIKQLKAELSELYTYIVNGKDVLWE